MKEFDMKTRVGALLAASALGLALSATAASAQDYGPNYGPGYGPAANNEEIIVTQPRYYRHEGPLNAPVEDVAMSRPVSYADLDLRTHWGAHKLKARVRTTALMLCHQIDLAYPVAADGNPPCLRTALEEAMPQADAAIARARGYADTGYSYTSYDEDR
jgi:UrcA family protein